MAKRKTKNPTGLSRRDSMTGAAAVAATLFAAGPAAARPPIDLAWLPAWKIREWLVSGQTTAASVTEHFLALVKPSLATAAR
jgi:hypothetical protein